MKHASCAQGTGAGSYIFHSKTMRSLRRCLATEKLAAAVNPAPRSLQA
jgi:hypothetical protein